MSNFIITRRQLNVLGEILDTLNKDPKLKPYAENIEEIIALANIDENEENDIIIHNKCTININF